MQNLEDTQSFSVTDNSQRYECEQASINLSLVHGVYKVARHWLESGDREAARRFFGFILSLKERKNSLVAREFALAQAALAQMAAEEEHYLVAEDLYLKALILCVEACGYDSHEYAGILRDYACLLRRLYLQEDARNLERRADQMARLYLPVTVDIVS